MFDTAKIEKSRILHALTKKELAERIGIHPYSYTRILKGEINNPKTIKALCETLGLSMEDVYIGGEDAA